MTDTRSAPRSEEDPNELLADFDELLFHGSTDEALSAAPGEDGPVLQAADDAPARELEDLEAFFDTFQEEAAPDGSAVAPAAKGAEVRTDGDSDGGPAAPAQSPGVSVEIVTGDESPPDGPSALEQLPEGAADAPSTGTSTSGDAGAEVDPAERPDPDAAGPEAVPGTQAEPGSPEPRTVTAAEPEEAVSAAENSPAPAGESAGEPAPQPAGDGSGQGDEPNGGEAEPAEGRKLTAADKDHAETADEVFPFVPAGTSVDDPPRHLRSESAPAAHAGSGAGMNPKLAFVAGGLIALMAVGAGLLAWEAHSGVAALNERLAGGPAPLSDSPTAAMEAMERRLDQLSQRLDALAASAPELRSEVQAAARRVAGLDARMEALRARVTTPVGASGTAGAGGAAGKWAVNLASVADEGSAREELARIRNLGIDAEIAPAPADGRTWYRIRVSGFDTAAAAKSYAQSEAAGAGFAKAWVGRQ